MVRWPGKIEPGTVKNGIVSGLDWFPTLLAAVGDTDVKDRLLKGWTPWAVAATPSLIYLGISLAAFGWLVIRQ